MEPHGGLRELKKARTRELIQDVALRLFSQRGFDHVPVAEIARTAEVAEKTVFNYFPTKEDLVFDPMEAFERDLLEAVRTRPPGEPILAAFRRFVLQPRQLLADRDPPSDRASSEELRARLRIIVSSPALLERERQVYERYTDALARLIRKETGSRARDPEPWIVANALVGVHRALVQLVQMRALAGTTNRRIAAEIKARGSSAFAVLERGLEGYCVKTET
jgi:AcrR family transcriptional regulator